MSRYTEISRYYRDLRDYDDKVNKYEKRMAEWDLEREAATRNGCVDPPPPTPPIPPQLLPCRQGGVDPQAVVQFVKDNKEYFRRNLPDDATSYAFWSLLNKK